MRISTGESGSVTLGAGRPISTGYGANPPAGYSYLLYCTTTVPPSRAKSRIRSFAAATWGWVS